MAVFEKLDELPIAETHSRSGAAALIAVMRIMPEKRTLGDFPALEEGTERYAVNRTGVHIHGFAEGGEEINARNRRVDDAAWSGNARPADEERFADAAFEQVPFARAQGRVTRDRLRAGRLIPDAPIIRKEDHNCPRGPA